MSTIYDKLTASNLANLKKLIGNDPVENFVGFVYSLGFSEAKVLVNDQWKEKVSGIPANCFLIATSLSLDNSKSNYSLDEELVLLRVVGPTPLPSDADTIKAKVEHNQRRESLSDNASTNWDVLTQNELQYGALECRVLGTFYLENPSNIRFGTDLENYASSTRLNVFKPTGEALGLIVNHVNSDVVKKAESDSRKAGFNKGVPASIEVGAVRYTSTIRLHQKSNQNNVLVKIHPSDFLARRTAIFGMTRTGKSNTVKTMISAVALAAKGGGVNVGQLIFDVNGEYANATTHDDDSSIANVFNKDCICYRASDTRAGFKDLRSNFYLDPSAGFGILQSLYAIDPRSSAVDVKSVMEDMHLDPPIQDEYPDRGSYISAKTRFDRNLAIWYCILYQAGFEPPPNFKVYVPPVDPIKEQIENYLLAAKENYAPTSAKVDLREAVKLYEILKKADEYLREAQKNSSQVTIGLSSTNTAGKPYFDPITISLLNVLTRKGGIIGYKEFSRHTGYHTKEHSTKVIDEIVNNVYAGKIVILDLSVGPVSIKTDLSEKIAITLFNRSMTTLNEGRTPPNVVVYVEEAHNLIDKKADLTSTWARLAKEGAKAKIAFVYSTQEPSSIHPNILANTENWFVTHLNNDDELKTLGKFYDFSDFKNSLKTAQDIGFARIKTLSSPFVVPVQISKFEPNKIAIKLQELTNNSQGSE